MIGIVRDRQVNMHRMRSALLMPILFGIAILCAAAPAAYADISITYIADSAVTLQWRAPGDDSTVGTAALYDIRYSTSTISAANWSTCTQVSNEPTPLVAGTQQSYTVQGLSSGTKYYFALKTADEIPNWSVLSNVVSATTTGGGDPQEDEESPNPPGAVSIYATTDTSISLRWMATGDDGVSGQASVYDIRYSTSPLTEANWASASQADNEPSPALPGTPQIFEVKGLASSTLYYLAIKIGDEVPNWSAMSAVVSATTDSEPPPPDTQAPAVIADLDVVDSSRTAITLTWTTPGDDLWNGYATAYDIRYHTSPITEANWNSASLVVEPPEPGTPETPERLILTGLSTGLRYYVAIKTADEVPNWSEISNVASAITSNATPSAPVPLSPLSGDTLSEGEDVSLSIYNSQDADGDYLTYDFWIATDLNFGQVIASRSNVQGGTGTTEVTFAATSFEAGVDYWWRAQASDGLARSSMSAANRFRLRAPCEQPMTGPVPISPTDSTGLSTLTPTLLFANSSPNPDCELDRFYEIMILSETGGFDTVVVDTVAEGPDTTRFVQTSFLQTGRYYWWKARCFNEVVVSPWSSWGVFHTPNNPPTVPSLRDPRADDTVTTRTPVLTAQESTDPDGTPLRYQFQISKLGNFSTFDSSSLISPSGGIVSWQTQDNLDDGAMYSWRVRAWDGIDFSAFSEVGTFLVNTGGTNNAPEEPIPHSPEHRAEVTTATPELVVDNGHDQDNDPLTYQFEVYRVSTNTLVSSVTDLAESPQLTSWVVADSLQDTVTYQWRSRCHDGKEYSKWSDYREFTLLLPSDNPNGEPTAPIHLVPTNGSIVLMPPVMLRVSNAIDPEGDPVVYDFWLYADSAMTQLVEAQLNVPEQVSQTQVTLSVNPINGQRYWWRCRARDATHGTTSPTDATWFIFSSMATGQEDFIPGLAMPEDGADVPSERPQLYASNIVAGGENDFYYFEIARDTMFIEMVVTSPPVPEQGEAEFTRWQVSEDLPAGERYYWRARANNNPYSAVSSFTVTEKIRAYPNPVSFTQTGYVTFNLPDEPVDLLIQSISGETVLEKSNLSGDWTWDGRNGNGQLVSVGTYLWFASSPGQYGKIVVKP